MSDETVAQQEFFSAARQRMVEFQIAARDVQDARVLDAMRSVERHRFVRPALAEFAYDDTPLPLEAGQTISQPFVVARMLEAAHLARHDHVLDVGTGSGYAAAVASRLCAQVYSIERCAELAKSASATLSENGFDNVDVRIGDGTLGWPEHAPFDAIIAAAGGPDVPAAWREQLAVGGRIVMPVGEERERQRLIKITRVSETQFDEVYLGEVRFVPLIGAAGWTQAGGATSPARQTEKAASLAGLIHAAAHPLPEPEDSGFADAFDALGSKRVVLLGECTHGTSEFYRARAAITRRLIERHGFTIVAVEADWPDAASIHRYITLDPQRSERVPFQRFPPWMWRNEEFAEFVHWMRDYNERLSGQTGGACRCGFYGLDMYSLSASMAAVLEYLDRNDPDAACIARERYGCLSPWQRDPQVYGRAAYSAGYGKCEKAVLEQLQDMLHRRLEQQDEYGFDAEQNARLVAAAERYYREMYRSSSQSWNLRDTHMFETLEKLLEFNGEGSRAVVWAHNSHIGNAAATEMGRNRGEVNIGQLCRERFGNDAALIGFGTHAGTTAAAADWDGPMRVKVVRPSREDSYEYQFHQSGQERCFVDLSGGARQDTHQDANQELRMRLKQARLERFIGVIYRPETELQSHYAQASLPDQFDGYVWFDTTRAVNALATRPTERSPDLYPFGQ